MIPRKPREGRRATTMPETMLFVMYQMFQKKGLSLTSTIVKAVEADGCGCSYVAAADHVQKGWVHAGVLPVLMG